MSDEQPTVATRGTGGGATIRWFGHSWGAPVCADVPHARTPIGDTCICCDKVVQQGDQGLLIPRVPSAPYQVGDGLVVIVFDAVHLNCWTRALLGERPDVR